MKLGVLEKLLKHDITAHIWWYFPYKSGVSEPSVGQKVIFSSAILTFLSMFIPFLIDNILNFSTTGVGDYENTLLLHFCPNY